MVQVDAVDFSWTLWTFSGFSTPRGKFLDYFPGNFWGALYPSLLRDLFKSHTMRVGALCQRDKFDRIYARSRPHANRIH
jgi:hypothetical protein